MASVESEHRNISFSQELDLKLTFVSVKEGHISYIDLHLPIETVVEEEVVGHADAVRLHGVTLAIVIIPNITWKSVD